MSNKIKRIIKEEYLTLVEKEKQGKKLSKQETLSMFVYRGMDESEAHEAYYVARPEYGKPDKNGIVEII